MARLRLASESNKYKREEKSNGKANDVLKEDQGSSDEEDKEGASLATIVLLLTSSFQ